MSYNYLTQFNANPANFTQGRQGTKITGITIHHWDAPNAGATFEGVIAHFGNPASQVSAHFVATGNGRRVACLVDMSDTAWQAGNWQANLETVGIECDPSWDDATYDVVAELIADIRQAIGDVPLYPHSHWVATACPGNVDLARLDALSRTKVPSGTWGNVTSNIPAPVVTPPVVTPPVIEPPVVTPPVVTPVVDPTPVVTPPVVTPTPTPVETPVPTPEPAVAPVKPTYSNIFSLLWSIVIAILRKVRLIK